MLKTGENKEIFNDEFKKSEFFQQKTDNFSFDFIEKLYVISKENSSSCAYMLIKSKIAIEKNEK